MTTPKMTPEEHQAARTATMTPTEVIESLAELGPQDFPVVLQFLADQVFDSRLNCGATLMDAYDLKQWLEELAIAAQARRAGLLGSSKSVAMLPEKKSA